MSTAAPVFPPIPRERFDVLVAEAVRRERERCVAIVRRAAPDAFGKIDWPHLRERLAKEIEKP